ncbi:MAG: PAS domain-containing protein [Elainella sp.]
MNAVLQIAPAPTQSLSQPLPQSLPQPLLQAAPAENVLPQLDPGQLALELTRSGWWDWDLRSDQLIWSNEMFILLGYAPGEVRPSVSDWRERIHPDDRDWTSQALQRDLTNRAIGEVEYRVIHPDGSLHWLLVKGQRICDAANQPVRMVGTAIEISDRKLLEAERQAAEIRLQDSEARYRLISEMSPIGIFRHDTAGHCTYVNEKILQLVGRQLADCLGPNWINTVYPDDRQQVAEIWQEFMAQSAIEPDAIQQLECRHLHSNGTIVWVWAQIAVERDAAGQITGYIGTLTDITARKCQEAHLALLAEIAEICSRLTLAEEIIAAVGAKIGAYLKVTACNFCEVNEAADQVIYFGRWQAAGDPRLPDRIRLSEQVSQEFCRLARAGEPIVSHSVQSNPLTNGEANELLGVRSFITVPFYQKGEWKYLFSVHDRVVRTWRDDEVELVREIASPLFPRLERARADLEIQKFATLVENSSEFIGLCDLNCVPLYLNPAGRRMVGLEDQPASEVLMKDYFFPEDQDFAIEQLLSQVLQTGRVEAEIRFRHLQTGETLWMILSAVCIRDEQGQPLALATISRNITDRKQIEAALRLSEEQRRLALELTNTASWDWYLETGEVIWSANMFGLLGLPPSSEPLTYATWRACVHPEDLARQEYAITLHLQNQTTYVEEYRVVYPNGQIHWLLSKGQGIYDAAGQAVRMVGIALDISERKFLEQEILQINTELELRVRARTQELEGAMRAAETASLAKTTFMSNISHELRTPLNAILGFSQLLSCDPALGSDQREQLNIINRSGEHLLKLINSILELSRIEAGQASLSVTDVDLGQLLQHLRELFRLQAAAKGLHLVIQSDAGVPRVVRIDESKLRQVLINLLGNAIKFTQEGQITLQVRLGERPPESRAAKAPACIFLYFAVQDQGPGMDAEEQALLFRPFQQTRAGQAAQEGTGLGLAISHELVQLMGGELCITSASGEGATFSFQIPVVPVTSQTVAIPPTQRQVVELAPDQPEYRVLVAEDDLENCDFLAQLLRSAGFEVQTAENGEGAVAIWQQWRPQLIWMDMQMPGGDGYEATRQIRALEAADPDIGPPTPIIALTGIALEHQRALILAAGCTDLVCKPAAIDTLFGKIKTYLGVRYSCRYENDSGSTEPIEPIEPPKAVLLAELQTRPAVWIRQLNFAARTLDEVLILQLLEQIPPSESLLADTLKEWLAQFQFEQLIELTTEANQ